MRKCAAIIETGDMLRRGDRLHRVAAVARVAVSGLSITVTHQGTPIDIPIPDTDTVRVWCDCGSMFSIPAAETVEVL